MDPLGQLKAENFQQMLACLSSSVLYIHKLQIWTSIGKEEYNLINLVENGNAKIYKESKGIRNVEFHFIPMAPL